MKHEMDSYLGARGSETLKERSLRDDLFDHPAEYVLLWAPEPRLEYQINCSG